ncbi:response regulator [Paraburkholderia guartelaensis]|uniref:Response regulator n=2 Tax=Paraburkholderia guartelaensis TaxID=2546446 RepID=A0A4R5L3M7_9BURK|nr:response regulator [Paraburkholderia guartelaensis]
MDDDPRLLDALAALVESDGFHVIKALDGAQALRCARAEQPAIVVTDYMMPVMDGEALVRALASDPGLAGVPVVLSSAVAAPPGTLHIAAFLRKPFAAARLLELLHQYTATGS